MISTITTYLSSNLYSPVITSLNIGIPTGIFFGTLSLIESFEKYKIINDEQLLAFNYIKNSNKTNLYMVQYPGHCLNKYTYGFLIQNDLTDLPKDFIGISFFNDNYKFKAESNTKNELEIKISCENNINDKCYITYLNNTVELPKLLLGFCPNLLNDDLSQANKRKILNLLTEENLIKRSINFEVKVSENIHNRRIIDKEQVEIMSPQLYQKLSDILLYNIENNLTTEDKNIIFDYLYKEDLVQNHKAIEYFSDSNNVPKWTVCEMISYSDTCNND